MIADLVREDPECEPAIADLLREVLPFTVAVFVPPGWDERYITSFGFTLQDIYTQGAEAMEGRLRAAGLDPMTMRLGLPFDMPAAARAARGLTLLRAGYLGERNGGVKPSPEATAMLFDGLRRQIDASVAPGATIQWDFSDAEPWHLRDCRPGRAHGSGARPRRGPRPDLSLSPAGLGRHRRRAHRAAAFPASAGRCARPASCGCWSGRRSCSGNARYGIVSATGGEAPATLRAPAVVRATST